MASQYKIEADGSVTITMNFKPEGSMLEQEEQIAQALAANHDERYVRQKAAYLDYLLEVSPEKVRNPKGWLRRAIEEDYGAPDGFKSLEEREAQKLEEERLEREREQYEREQALLALKQKMARDARYAARKARAGKR